jgi:FixJ family two-component response regulator
VVMFTGEARMETFMRSMEAGAADFLVKPFTREALVAKLSKYLPLQADVTGMPRNWPATAGPVGRG